MNFWKNGAATLALMAVAGAAHAQFSSTVTVTNDYDFRGFTQTDENFAFQASADYAFGESGWAIGAWASNIDFPGVDGDIELDLYASYTGTINEQTSWNAGFVWYDYPGSDDLDGSPEIYVGADYGNFGVKQWYSWDQFASGETGFYTEANASFPLPQNFSILAHLGYSWGDYWKDGFGDEVLDYSIGVGYDFPNVSLAAKWVDTDYSGSAGEDLDGRFVITLSTTLPW